MSKKMDFPDRLREAAKKKGVAYSQQAIGSYLGCDRRNVDAWMKGSLPRADVLFDHADKWGVDPRWYATGEGEPTPRGKPPPGLDPAALDLLQRYQEADPRWQLSLRLLSYVATEEQREVASDVNLVLARVFGKSPRDIKYISDERAAKAIGDAPHVAARKRKDPR